MKVLWQLTYLPIVIFGRTGSETSNTSIFIVSCIDVQKRLSGLKDTTPGAAAVGASAEEEEEDEKGQIDMLMLSVFIFFYLFNQ